ncbi:pilus assembly protein [Pseudomonas stutzeri]|nr:pilus assembly protein [Stutzerimonas stutzeri]MCQ4325828.1 pilus assembly protein [Stutzerimonas stutzeri]
MSSRQHQLGAVAIEFAALFVSFFVTFYAILAYSLPLLLTLSFKEISADAARAAIKVNPAQAPADYVAAIDREVSRVVEASWLPAQWRNGDCPPPGPGSWQRLPATSGTAYGHLRLDDSRPEDGRLLLHVCLQRKYNRDGPASEAMIIPPLRLLSFSIPDLPEHDGETVLRGRTVIRL